MDVEKETINLGGAGNVLNNLAEMGASVRAAGVLGDDQPAKEIRSLFDERGASTEFLLVQNGRNTGKKSRVIATHQQVIRIDRETRTLIDSEMEDRIIKVAQVGMSAVNGVILSDYGKGVLTPRVLQEVIKLAKAQDKKVVIDPKGWDYNKYSGAYVITPNRKEASEAVGFPITNMEEVEQAGKKLRKDCGFEYVIITLSEDGMAIIGDSMVHIPTRARDVF